MREGTVPFGVADAFAEATQCATNASNSAQKGTSPGNAATIRAVRHACICVTRFPGALRQLKTISANKSNSHAMTSANAKLRLTSPAALASPPQPAPPAPQAPQAPQAADPGGELAAGPSPLPARPPDVRNQN